MAALFFWITTIPFFLLPHQEQLIIISSGEDAYLWRSISHRILVYLSGVVYVLLSLWLLQKHKLAIQNRFSQSEKINLMWLRYQIYGLALVWLAVFYGDDRFIFSLVGLFVLFLGYFGVKQVGIFTQAPSGEILPSATTELSEDNPVESGRIKYQKSSLTTDGLQQIHQKLLQAMSEQKLFTNPELTLAELAQVLSVHPNHLSQVINTMESKTFYDFVNNKRIEEFKKKITLSENQKYTLLALAFECGFNSKTAFYRNFKAIEGQSPTNFLKQRKVSIPEE